MTTSRRGMTPPGARMTAAERRNPGVPEPPEQTLRGPWISRSSPGEEPRDPTGAASHSEHQLTRPLQYANAWTE